MCCQSCQTLCNPMEHRPSGFSVHVTFQAIKQMGCHFLPHLLDNVKLKKTIAHVFCFISFKKNNLYKYLVPEYLSEI